MDVGAIDLTAEDGNTHKSDDDLSVGLRESTYFFRRRKLISTGAGDLQSTHFRH